MKSSNSFDDILFSPWALWAISLATAILMWSYGLGAEDDSYITRKIRCSIEYRNVEPQAVLRNKVEETEVEVKGLESVINRLNHNDIICYVDLKNRESGRKYTEEVRVNLPPDIILLNRYPSQVVIDQMVQVGRFFKVLVTLPKDMPEGQYLEAIDIIPKEITIKGSEKDLAKVGEVQVQPTVKELQTGKEMLLPVSCTQSEPFEDEVIMEPSQVKVNASLVRGLPKKKIPVNVRLTGKVTGDYEIKSVVTDPAEVMVEGTQAKLDKITAIDTETVDISSVSADKMIVVPLKPLEVRGVSVLNVKSVNLTIYLEPIRAQKQFINIPLLVKGNGGTKRWEVTPTTVTVTIEGMPSQMANVSSDKIGLHCWVDVSNIFLNTAALPVRSEVTSGDFNVVKIEPSTVTVNAIEEAAGW